jgi:predicted nucleic acid-binding protein
VIYVLDTNVLSDVMKPSPSVAVAAWMRAQSPRSLFTSSICQAEILAGVAVLPTGRRRAEFEAMALAISTREFDGRILPFDMQAASANAEIFANRRQMAGPIETADLIVAATARDTAVVTRDRGGFEGRGLMLINPWDA